MSKISNGLLFLTSGGAGMLLVKWKFVQLSLQESERNPEEK
jgi:hypothetical protein